MPTTCIYIKGVIIYIVFFALLSEIICNTSESTYDGGSNSDGSTVAWWKVVIPVGTFIGIVVGIAIVCRHRHCMHRAGGGDVQYTVAATQQVRKGNRY